jgi:hypothetical protein
MAKAAKKAALAAESDIPSEDFHEASGEPQRELKPGEVLGRDGEILARKRGTSHDIFKVPDHLKDPLYDYNWKVETVLGQQMVAQQVESAENGWRPVMTKPGSRWEGVFMPAGYEGPVRRNGLTLHERPMELTRQATAEEAKKARDQVRASVDARGLNFNVPTGYSTENPTLNAWQKQNTRQGVEPGPPQAKHPTATTIDG